MAAAAEPAHRDRRPTRRSAVVSGRNGTASDVNGRHGAHRNVDLADPARMPRGPAPSSHAGLAGDQQRARLTTGRVVHQPEHGLDLAGTPHQRPAGPRIPVRHPVESATAPITAPPVIRGTGFEDEGVRLFF